jgi:hypothetical protein
VDTADDRRRLMSAFGIFILVRNFVFHYISTLTNYLKLLLLHSLNRLTEQPAPILYIHTYIHTYIHNDTMLLHRIQ